MHLNQTIPVEGLKLVSHLPMEFDLLHQKALQNKCCRQNLKNTTVNAPLQTLYIKEERWKSSIEISVQK